MHKGVTVLIGAGIPYPVRRGVYKRDGWRCALCDSTDGIQIHHVIPRGEGGSDFPENLITSLIKDIICFMSIGKPKYSQDGWRSVFAISATLVSMPNSLPRIWLKGK